MRGFNVVASLIVAALSGCGGSASGPEAQSAQAPQDAACLALAGPGTTTHFTADSTCVGCEVTSPELAIDGDPATFATVILPVAAEGGAFLRAAAQPGLVFPSGNEAGVRMNMRATASADLGSTLTLRTYLGGQPQETIELEVTRDGNSNINGVGGFGRTDGSLLQLPATQPFDAVELGLSGRFNGLSLRVFEFCSDL